MKDITLWSKNSTLPRKLCFIDYWNYTNNVQGVFNFKVDKHRLYTTIFSLVILTQHCND